MRDTAGSATVVVWPDAEIAYGEVSF